MVLAWADPPLWDHHIHPIAGRGHHDANRTGAADRYLNNVGDIAFDRWHEDSHTWQVWLYRQGQFYQITSDPFWNFGGDIDDFGNVAFVSGDDYTVMTNIHLLQATAARAT